MKHDVGRAAQLSTAEDKAAEDRIAHIAHLAEGFRRTVAQAAWMYWRRLPVHTRIWVSVEDMIEDGMLFLISENVMAKHNAKRGQMSTFLTTVIRNFFDEHYYHKLVMSNKRNEKHLISLEEIAAKRSQLTKERAMELAMREHHDYLSAMRMQRNCFVVPLMLRVYREASENLQEEIRHWFLSEGGERFYLGTPKFTIARKEFLKLAKNTGLAIDDCRHLLVSPCCMDQLSREIRWVPYDVNNPTPELR